MTDKTFLGGYQPRSHGDAPVKPPPRDLNGQPTMTENPAPHEIRLADGRQAYHCRNCRAADNLHWFGDTSCPVCDKPACSKAVSDEYNAALDAMREGDF